MEPTTELTVALDLRLDERGSIDGRARAEGSDPITFAGWLGLVAAVTSLADRVSAGDSPTARADLLDTGVRSTAK